MSAEGPAARDEQSPIFAMLNILNQALEKQTQLMEAVHATTSNMNALYTKMEGIEANVQYLMKRENGSANTASQAGEPSGRSANAAQQPAANPVAVVPGGDAGPSSSRRVAEAVVALASVPPTTAEINNEASTSSTATISSTNSQEEPADAARLVPQSVPVSDLQHGDDIAPDTPIAAISDVASRSTPPPSTSLREAASSHPSPPSASSYNPHDSTGPNVVNYANRLPTPQSTRGGTERPPSTRSFGSSSSDGPVTKTVGAPPKRKRKINQPRSAPLAPLYEQEPESSKSAKQKTPSVEPTVEAPSRLPPPLDHIAATTSLPPLSPSTATKRKFEDFGPDAPAETLPKKRKLGRPPFDAVFIDIDIGPELRQRMQAARRLHEVMEHVEMDTRPSTPTNTDYEDAFGAEDLSDLTDISDDENDNATARKTPQASQKPDSETQVHAQLVVDIDTEDSEAPARPPRRESTKTYRGTDADLGSREIVGLTKALKKQDEEDDDYKPGGSHHVSAPGPSRKSQRSVHPDAEVAHSSNSDNWAGKVSYGESHWSSDKHRPANPAVPASGLSEHSKPKSTASASRASAEHSTADPKGKGKAEPTEFKLLRAHVDIKPKIGRNSVIPDGSEGMRERLETYKDVQVKLEPEIRGVLVTRKFMLDTYGAHPQKLYSAISPKARDEKGGHRHEFAFPQLEMNPELPKEPGHPGLLCRVLPECPWGAKTIKLVIGVGQHQWWYMGDYIALKTKSLSHAEWIALPAKTKTAWAVNILDKDKYLSLRTRISLRSRFGREPTEEEVADEVPLEKARLDQIPRKDRKPTDAEIRQIVNAYSSGEEIVHIWVVKCLGYDEDFQRELMEKCSGYVPVPKARKRGAADGVRHDASPKKPGPLRPDQASSGPVTIRIPAIVAAAQKTPAPRRDEPRSALPSPPSTPPAGEAPPPSGEPPDLLSELRQLWTAERGADIPDAELAGLLRGRRTGLRQMKSSGKIQESQYVKLQEFARSHGYGWSD